MNFLCFMYAFTCIISDIILAVGKLCKYQTDPEMDHYELTRYLQGMNDYMLTFKKFNHLVVIDNYES